LTAPLIELSGINKRFGEKVVLQDLNLSVDKGEIFTLIGPSGTGKTTLLRLINLLDMPTTGEIRFDGINTAAADRLFLRRMMGMVFQKPVPLRGTVFENIATGLWYRGAGLPEITEQVPDALALVGLTGYEDRVAGTLSGGEMQRVAIARAIVTRPKLLLLDEPTANLDPASTSQIEELITRINEQHGTTILLSTHDMIQGQRVAHRMAVLLNGRVSQVGTAHAIFYQPSSREVARLVGVDNVLTGTVISVNDALASVDVEGNPIAALTTCNPGTRVLLFLRPEDITLSPPAISRTSARNVLAGTITRVVQQGPMVRVQIDCGFPLTAVVTRQSCEELAVAPKKPITVSFKASALHVTPADP